ncbi:MAG: DUF5916 domain-containing protein [Pseudomonadales bacterium]|nr:DUF5916 domain-containing protein [Pseudomonadales bacterium]
MRPTGIFNALLTCALGLLSAMAVALPSTDGAGAVRPPRIDDQAADILIDGRLDEAAWARAPFQDDFVVIEPDTLASPDHRTRVQFLYSDRGLYVGVTNEQPPQSLVPRLSGRDARINRDSVSITIDPTGSGLFGYWFSVSLGGSLTDGTVLPERQFSNQWDGPWNGASAETANGWTAEYFLPWSMMAMPQSGDERRIGFYVSRKVAYLDQRWAVPALPSTTPRFMSALRSLVIRGVQPSRQLTFYPFSAATVDSREGDFESKIGADIYWRPSSNLQVSGTLNPDFGTVVQDDLVVNLSAFEVFFNERRPFFLEGQEVFSTSPRATGSYQNGPQLTLLNTRRIGAPPARPSFDGLESISEADRTRLSDLVGATKVTGQSGAFRYGALAALEQDSEVTGFLSDGEAIDFAVKGRRFGAVRGLWEQSEGGAYQGLGGMITAVGQPGDDGFVGALDGHLLSAGGTWKLDTQAMASQAEDRLGGGLITDVVFTPKQGRIHQFAFDLFDRDFDINDFGFLRRNDLVQVRYRYEQTRSDLDHVRDRQTRFRFGYGENLDGLHVASGVFAEREWTFHDLSKFRFETGLRPARWDDRNSFGNGPFRIEDRGTVSMRWSSNDGLELSGGLFGGVRQEDLQDLTYSGGGFVSWRPSDRFTARMEVEYTDRSGWLLHQEDQDFTTFDAIQWAPEFALEYYFSARQQLRASMQWIGLQATEQEFLRIAEDGRLVPRTRAPDAEADDFSISNAILQFRYRWEIAPLSDLFVVYTRGGSLDDPDGRSFEEMLARNLARPDTDQLVVMLRYRLGS